MVNHLYAVIMAGGKGERFWPMSRDCRPKQMLSLFSPESLLEQTVARIHQLVPLEHIFILTNGRYIAPIRKLLPQLPECNVIGEPCRRDTAPCIALACGVIKAQDPEAIMMVFPADHAIVDLNAFQQDLQLAAEVAAEHIVTIGIVPTHPSPDYGYIEVASREKVAQVQRFIEKPSVERARELLAKGNYFWNGGIFLWHVRVLHEAFGRHAPEFCTFSDRVAEHWARPGFVDFLREEFEKLPRISIDYAVMEKERNIQVVAASFGWDDVGNWASLANHIAPDGGGNTLNGKVVLLNSENNIIFSSDENHLVAGIDLRDLTIIHTPDATLVCRRESGAKLKALLKKFQDNPDLQRYL